MKKLFSAILSAALVFSTVAGAAAMDISLTAKSYNVKSETKADNVFVTEDFSSYNVGDNLIVKNDEDKVGFTNTDKFTVVNTKSNAYTIDSFIGFVSDPTGSNNGNVLKLQADNGSFFPVVRYDGGIGTPQDRSKKLSVRASIFIDKDTAKGLFVGEDYNDSTHTPKWSRLDAETIGFMSVWAYPWNAGQRQSAIGTLAFDNTKVKNGSYTFDGKTIPAYINAPNTKSGNPSYDSTQNTAKHLADVTLPVGEWFDVEFVYDLPKAVDNTSANGSVPMTVYIAGKQVYSDTVIIPKKQDDNNFYNVYRGVAFSPNAYINADNKGETKPIMYVDNIQAKYFSEKFASEDFSTYDVSENLLTDAYDIAAYSADILGGKFRINKTYTNTGKQVGFKATNAVKVSKDPVDASNKVLALTSSTDSTFPIVNYVNKIGTSHESGKSLAVSANLYFDASTAKGYNLSADNESRTDDFNQTGWHLVDNTNMGFMSVYAQDGTKWSNRSTAIGTLAFNTGASWNGEGNIPAYINFPNTENRPNVGDGSNTGYHTKEVTLPTGKWFEVKFVYDLNAKIAAASSNGSVPVCVYIDGEKVYEGTSLIPTNKNFNATYQGIAFSPNAYISSTNKGSVAPTMYVDNINVDYVNETNNVSFIIANSLEEAKGPMDIIAVAYDANDVVLEVKYVKGFTLDKSAELGKSISFSDNVGDVKTVRLFAWDSLENMTPYAESATVSK